MQLSWPAWILVICAVASLVFVIAGVVIALRANARFNRHVAATAAFAQSIVDVERLNSVVRRLEADDISLALLADRVDAAGARINAALNDLRLPQAMLAVRTANAAIRLLLSGR
jgi:hypothetical protein